jgi:hypothetical protein
LYLHKGVRGASPGRGLGLRGGGATGHPFYGLAVHKKQTFFDQKPQAVFRETFFATGIKNLFSLEQ